MALLRLLLFSAALLAIPASAQPFAYYRGVVNAASYVPSGLPHGQIARGSIFTLFGRSMGPAVGVQVDAFPLGNTLAGVSLEICQQTTCMPAIPIYVRQDQINAILPSNAPLGGGSLRVTYNGQAGNFTSVTVVERSPGIFAINSGGFGPAVVQNFISQTNQPVNSAAAPARPGQTVILWGTGLGPGLNADNVAPQVGDLPVQLEIWVGGKAVTTKRYQGRSGCCSGLDQLVFDLPSDTPTGCYVPIQLAVNGVISNTATIAVSGGDTCSDSFNPISERFRQGGKLGYLSASRSSTIHNFVTETREEISDSLLGTFRRVQPSPFYFDPQISLPPIGSCTVNTVRGDLLGGDELPGFVSPASELDAGASLRVGPSTVPRDGVTSLYSGNIAGNFANAGLPEFLLTAPATLSGSGGADIGAFQMAMTPPAAIAFSNRANLEVVERGQGLTVNWQGGTAGTDVILIAGIGTNLPENSSAQFLCVADPAAGAFTVPPRILQALPALSAQPGAEDAFTYVFVGRSPLRSPQTVTASGADAAFGLVSQWAGKAIVIR